jgi:hypothetical protein
MWIFRWIRLGKFRPHCPCGLRRGSAAARLLRLQFRISPGAWMPVFFECCVCLLSVRRADYSTRGVLLSVVCLSVISKPHRRGRLGPLGLSSHNKNKLGKSRHCQSRLCCAVYLMLLSATCFMTYVGVMTIRISEESIPSRLT